MGQRVAKGVGRRKDRRERLKQRFHRRRNATARHKRSCKKDSYDTEVEAQIAAEKAMTRVVWLKEQPRLGVYLCRRHRAWHYGHRDWKETGDKFAQSQVESIRDRKN